MTRVVKVFGLIVGLAVGTWVFLYTTVKPVTKEQAETIAVEAVRGSGQQLGFDVSLFHGPEPFVMTSQPHAFQWTFVDQAGTVRLLVFVDEYGGSELTWEGNLERLRTRR